MANFKIPENKEDISWFDLPLNRTMKLLQSGGDATGNKGSPQKTQKIVR
jgi:hypothetical protein